MKFLEFVRAIRSTNQQANIFKSNGRVKKK